MAWQLREKARLLWGEGCPHICPMHPMMNSRMILAVRPLLMYLSSILSYCRDDSEALLKSMDSLLNNGYLVRSMSRPWTTSGSWSVTHQASFVECAILEQKTVDYKLLKDNQWDSLVLPLGFPPD